MPLFGELRRRNIFKVSLAYAIVSWLIVQVADIVLPVFQAPSWVMQILVLLLILIFPIAVLLAWAYELTPEGFKPSSDVDKTQSITVRTGQKLNHAVVVLLSTAVIFLVVDNYLLKGPEAPIPADLSYRKSIAALPFVNRSAAEENAQFLADGLHDELLTRLSKISDLRVISRTSVMGYRDTTPNLRQIGEELGVGSILEGGLQRSGNDVRINVQLIDARTDENLWADTFDAELTAANVFAIQSDISNAIAEALEAELSPAEQQRVAAVPTKNIVALEAYFTGRQLVEQRTVESILSAIDQFEQAVAVDPEFANAWAGIAEGWLELPNYYAAANAQKVRREASSAAIRAVTLDPDSPDALAALGWHLLLHNYDWGGAEDAFRKALHIDAANINALHWYSHLLSWQGKHDEAIIAADLALRGDPLSDLIQSNVKFMAIDAGRWDEGLDVSYLDVGEFSALGAFAWIGNLRAGRGEEAARLLLQWAETTGRDVVAAGELGELFIRAMTQDEPIDVDQALLERMEVATEIPEIYATFRDGANTIRSLEEADRTGVGFRSLLSMKINPSYDFVRDDPRFRALLEEVGLAD